ncbi:MAG TPA: complex I subunit 1 family protein, partial [Polyangiaceae bacterium]|nr:complex I subunit 1 family protein [Polyangiaceae bacterium]
MSLVEVILMIVKIVAVILLMIMPLAIMLTWADRRLGAMVQDRVGPNRAVVWLPTPAAQAGAVLPALGVCALVAYVAFGQVVGLHAPPSPDDRASCAQVFCHLAIFMTWVTFAIISGLVVRRGARSSLDLWIKSFPPRHIVYAGFGAHLLAIVLSSAFAGTEQGLVLIDWYYGGGAAILMFAVLFGAGYAAFAIRNEPQVGLRLLGLPHAFVADGLKTLWKEDFIPPNADKLLHSIAPLISFFPALTVFAVIPFGDTLCFGTTADHHLDITKLAHMVPREGVCVAGSFRLQVVDLNVGLLYFFALAGTGIVGAALAGWASDNKYSLLGGLRAASQMVSYEVTMGLTLIGAMMVYGTLRLDEMVRWQGENTWGIFVQPLAFVLFFASAVAESKRIPFDLPEGESEIVAGYFTEYAGMKFAMFFFSEYIAVVSSSALLAVIFLGGWNLPFLYRDGFHVAIGGTALFDQPLAHGLVIVLGVLAFLLKVVTLCWLQLMIRWTLPRFRYDQLMRLGWRKLLPASLVNILATGLGVMLLQGAEGPLAMGLRVLCDASTLLVGVVMAALLVWLVVFLLKPVHKRQ